MITIKYGTYIEIVKVINFSTCVLCTSNNFKK